MMLNLLDQAVSLLSSILRLGSGARAVDAGPRPTELLTIYEFEGCPFCRKVREAMTRLDLDVDVRPCPKGGQRFRSELVAMAGKAQFPYLIDPSTGDQMYESAAIIRHLYTHYGNGRPPLILSLGPLTDLLLQLAMIPRLGRGVRVRPSRLPEQALILTGYEASPGTRRARELLTTMELPYRLLQAPPGGARQQHSATRVPDLLDPANDQTVSGADAIIGYLLSTYR